MFRKAKRLGFGLSSLVGRLLVCIARLVRFGAGNVVPITRYCIVGGKGMALESFEAQIVHPKSWDDGLATHPSV